MKKLIQQICTSLNDGEDLVLVTISSQSGSTPRLAGAKMIIHRDGRIAGTIGGGLVEAQAMKEAPKCFACGHSMRRAFDLSNGDAAVTDMICGGKMELFLEFIRADEGNREAFQDLHAAMASGRRAALVCPLDADSGHQRFVIDHKGRASHVPEELLAAADLRAEPVMPRPAARTAAAQAAPEQAAPPSGEDLFPEHNRDEQFEIPAFLRRQGS